MLWRAADRKTAWLGAALGGTCAAYLAIYLTVTLGSGERYPFGDFFALWSYGVALVGHPAAFLYDFDALRTFQLALGMSPHLSNPFPYPPGFLPLVAPLGLLAYGPAYVAWVTVSLLGYLAAVALGSPPRPLLGLLALLAPTSAITLVAGQGGLLMAALLIGGMRLATSRPALGGVLLGLLTCKPQLGLLVPVALAAAGLWRTMAWAAAAAVMLAVASAAAFGWGIWADWLDSLPGYAARFAVESTDYRLMPTVTAAARMLGASTGVAALAQGGAALCAAALVWLACRRGITAGGLLALVAGTFLATPHAFVYDLPALSAAILLLAAERLRNGGALTSGALAGIVLALLFPAAMLLAGPRVPVGATALVLAVLLTRPLDPVRA